MLDEPFRKEGDNYGRQEKSREAQAREEDRKEENHEEALVVLLRSFDSYLC